MLSHVYAYSPFLVQGDSNKDVLECQKKLKTMGYKVDKLDGVFNTKFAETVQAFQKRNRLKITGVISSREYKMIIGREMAVDKNVSLLQKKLCETAGEQLGIPYKFGGDSPLGFDCSGYTMYVFKQHDISLERTVDKQFMQGKKINKAELKIGDLVFFTTYEKGASHVGIYVGDQKFIHASASKGVMISRLEDYYWKDRYIGARRVLKDKQHN